MIWNLRGVLWACKKSRKIYSIMKHNSFDPGQGENQEDFIYRIYNLTVQFGLTKEINVGAQSNMYEGICHRSLCLHFEHNFNHKIECITDWLVGCPNFCILLTITKELHAINTLPTVQKMSSFMCLQQLI